MQKIIEFEGVTYQIFATGDGSPSLRLSNVPEMQSVEAMHHCDGALSESLYIYGSLLEKLFLSSDQRPDPRILSVGLGCGYNEWIALAMVPDTLLVSFEANRFLRETFIAWLCEERRSSDGSTDDMNALFEEVLGCVAGHFHSSPQSLKTHGRELFESKRWCIRERLDGTTSFTQKFSAILFDAFSAKSTPELWSEEFLDRFLALVADQTCGFATYAATGRLNRALIRAGFRLERCQGFSGKRESTLAFR